MLARHPSGFDYLEPLELAWGLASPVVGHDCDNAIDLALTTMSAQPTWRFAVLAGLPIDSDQSRSLHRKLPARWVIQQGESTVRHVASLAGGMEGFCARTGRGEVIRRPAR